MKTLIATAMAALALSGCSNVAYFNDGTVSAYAMGSNCAIVINGTTVVSACDASAPARVRTSDEVL